MKVTFYCLYYFLSSSNKTQAFSMAEIELGPGSSIERDEDDDGMHS